MRTRLVPIALAGLLVGGAAPPDGKFFWREAIPPGIPYQRAILWHANGVETLLVQSKYVLPQADSAPMLGWVIPVPGVPEVASVPALEAGEAFFTLGLRTGPVETDISTAMALIGFFGFPVLIFLVLVAGALNPIIEKLPPWFRRVLQPATRTFGKRPGRWGTVFALAWVLSCMGSFMAVGGFAGVDVLSDEHVGIYDVQVIASHDASALITWLGEREHAFGDEDRAAVQAYLDRGWVFTVATVNPAPEDAPESVTSEGLVAPLILRFATDTAVYPLALTGTGGRETEILLYVLSDRKMITDGRLELRYAGRVGSGLWGANMLEAVATTSDADTTTVSRRQSARRRIGLEAVEPDGFWDAERALAYVTKFGGTLTADAMAEDLLLTPATDDEPFREHVTRW